jgi:hypothetical protein
VNPSAFGVYLSHLGRGALTLSVNGVSTSVNDLSWTGDVVFPGGALAASFQGVSLSLRSFAPLSPFSSAQGFFPLLLAQLSVASASAVNVTLAYAFACDGLYAACAGGGGGVPPTPPGPAPAFYSAAQVFVGAAMGDTNAASAEGCAPPRGDPPPVNFTRIGGSDTAIGGKDCPFGGWGDGSGLHACEVSCVEDPSCNAINFNSAIADCVFRVCSDPSAPATSRAPGYSAYATTAQKPPRPALCASASAALAAGGLRQLLLVFGQFDANGKYVVDFPTPAELFSFAVGAAGELIAAHAAFVAALPSTGDARGDESVRWLAAPAVLLTKGVGAQTSTMGYVEMCSRDSFYTTYLHAYMWPDLDRDMIREFVAWQCNASVPRCGGAENDGKIPTTILPAIYRDDNIDITGYFLLRVARYVQATGDEALLREVYPAMRRALLYLLRRAAADGGGGGLPAANRTSQWADWLDVEYMVGRKYAPHFVAVTLAALRVGAEAAAAVGAGADAAQFAAALERGRAFFHAPLTCDTGGTGCGGGGMWNVSGGFWGDVWWDGSSRNYTLTDQFVAVLFGATDGVHGAAALAHLLGPSGVYGPAGLRDFFPYFPHASDPPATYGNGGAYIWMNCALAATLLGTGQRAAGVALWNQVAARALYSPDQPVLHQAWEYLNGDTGKAMGAAPFGGDGACFAVATLGDAHAWALAEPPVAATRLAAAGGGAAAARCSKGGRTFVLRGAPEQPLMRPLGGGGLWARVESGGHRVHVVAGVSADGAWLAPRGGDGACEQRAGGEGGRVHACALPSGETVHVLVQGLKQ